MSNLKEIKNRIYSISSIMQMTRAMKMVSAAKLKKHQKSITHVYIYYDKIKEFFDSLYSIIGNNILKKKYIKSNSLSNKILIIVITSNRGLCGSFNIAVVREVYRLIENFYSKKEITILTIGKKGKNFLSNKYTIYQDWSNIFENFNFDKLSNFSDTLIKQCLNGTFNKIQIVYNKFKQEVHQIVISEQFFPIIIQKEKVSKKFLDYIFDPSQEIVFEEIIPKILKIHLFKSILESISSENKARMIAMHQATENASDIKNNLILTYNKLRQTSITKEILEIVSGSESLK